MKKYYVEAVYHSPRSGHVSSHLAHISQEVYKCSEADAIIENTRVDRKMVNDQLMIVLEQLEARERDLEHVMHVAKADAKDFNKALAARDKTIERLKELVKLGYKEGLADGLENGLPYPDWETSDTKKQLDSILGLSAPAAAPQR